VTISLHQRLAPHGRLQVWVGLGDTNSPPNLELEIDGARVTPEVVRPITSARDVPAMARPDWPRAFTGIFELADPDPSRPHLVKASAGGRSASLVTKSIPSLVPRAGERPLRILLASCFHVDEDKQGIAGALARNLAKTSRPDLSLFLGDQVYLDLPTLQSYDPDLGWLAREFERRYAGNWFMPGGYSEMIRLGPAVFTPDDHEYWNNFPLPSPIHRTTWDQAGRDAWRRAATAMWSAFQQHGRSQPGEPIRLDIPPLSIFIADTRSERSPDFARSMTPQTDAAMGQWASDVIANRWCGLLVTGQSIFVEKSGWLSGRSADSQLADYRDYKSLVGHVRRIVDAGRPVLCATGDMHWGRLLSARSRLEAERLWEVMSSPSSLVTNMAKDYARQFRSFFGPEPDWPRHSDPPEKQLPVPDIGVYDFSVLHRQKGNHVVTLDIARTGPESLAVTARFRPLHPTRDLPDTEVELHLRPRA